MTITTPRLDLVPATVESLAAAIDGSAPLAAQLGVEVPPTWPPEFLDEQALRWVMDRIQACPDQVRWWLSFMVLRGERGRRTLIGTAGYKGPPTDDGAVEIGYSVVADRHRQGFASEAARALLERAFADPMVTRVVAETLPELVGSIGVLHRCGFRFVGEGSAPGVIRYEIARTDPPPVTRPATRSRCAAPPASPSLRRSP